MAPFVGTAGWALPRERAESFPGAGSHLERYARVLGAVEINSSFYRPHRRQTYERWAASVPAEFRFAVKVPREITHECALSRAREPLERFLDEVAGLGEKLGPLLVQLPPSLELGACPASSFFALLRRRHSGSVVCEPRHASWFSRAAERVLAEHRVARVAADPAPVAGAERPGAFGGLVYHRLHGAPRMYFSPYPHEYLVQLAERLEASAAGVETWCIFDNTGFGNAFGDALAVTEMLAHRASSARARRVTAGRASKGRSR